MEHADIIAVFWFTILKDFATEKNKSRKRFRETWI